MDTKYSLEYFGFDTNDVKHDLSFYYQQLLSKKAISSVICKQWESVEDYVNAAYIFKFIKKYSVPEIRKLTDINSYYSIYTNIGLAFDITSNDFEEATKQYNKYLNDLKEIRTQFKIEDYDITEDDFNDFYKKPKEKYQEL